MMYFKLFSNCKIVLGHTNAVLHDLDRETMELLPLDFANLLLQLDGGKTLKDIRAEYNEEDQSVIDTNIQYFCDKEYGIICSKELFDCFPPMALDYSQPSTITNAIIELKIASVFYLGHYLQQLEELGCFYVSIIMYEKLNEKLFYDILSQVPTGRIKSIELVSVWHDEISDDLFSRITPFAQQLTKLSFTSAPFDKMESWDREKNILFHRQFSKERIENFSHCGKVAAKYFTCNLANFLESVNHNSCLHKKIAIDLEGDIKNCPAFKTSFGNAKITKLKEMLARKDFKKYWDISKDHIAVCKDCEFRYVCTDCRAYTEAGIAVTDFVDLSKPLKCGYDPYTGKWDEWTNNPLKQKAINFYDFSL